MNRGSRAATAKNRSDEDGRKGNKKGNVAAGSNKVAGYDPSKF